MRKLEFETPKKEGQTANEVLDEIPEIVVSNANDGDDTFKIQGKQKLPKFRKMKI